MNNEETITTGADTLIKLTDNKDNSGLYTITHPKDTTLQIGADKDITEYRYRGASPKNYVSFNGETWRIIGVFPTDDGTGNIENRIKIIRNESIGGKYWDEKATNDWVKPATLNTELNTTYLNNLSPTAQSMIGNTKYYLGGYSKSTIQKDVMYQYERKINGSTYYYGSNPNNWVGKLGLMYASDYGYAASDECTQTLSNYKDTTCKNNNWLLKRKEEWLLPQNAGTSNYAFIVRSDGEVNSIYVKNTDVVRPVLYLTSSVEIIGGNGTSTEPYVLDMNSKDTSGASAPVLASNMIPVYYDDSKNVWKCADKDNKDIVTRWYHYDYKMWANAVTINYSDSSIKNRYFNSDGTLKIKPGEEVLMDDITTMWVWIPRFNTTTPSNYNGGTQTQPNAIDVTFVKQNEVALDAFTFGNKELSGFWYGKFEVRNKSKTKCNRCNICKTK
ncbi:unknown [Mycoplasma sp. CAG:611]|nr:unknown [Mycoplasma sp. CAG:611]